MARAAATLDPDMLLVLGLYDVVLHRRPDPSGFEDNVAALRAGAEGAGVRAAVVASAEAGDVRDEDVPDVDHLRMAGLEVAVRGDQVLDGRDARVERHRRGVPLSVVAHDLDPTRPLPWESVLAGELLRWVPATTPGDLEQAVIRLARREAPHAVLAPHVPGTHPVARWRRHRMARRAVDFTMIRLAARAGVDVPPQRPQADAAVTVAAPRPVAAADAAPDVLTQLETRLTRLERRPAVRVVSVAGLLFGVPAREWRLAAYLEHRGHPEPGLADLVRQRVEPGSAFVDVGANIGLYTVEMAHRVGPSGSVVAFEPSPVTAAVLRQNVQLNGLAEGGTVRVVDAAVGDRPGTLPLALHDDDSGHDTLFPDGGGHDGLVEVAVTTLDDAIPPGARVDVVKVDVEGAEVGVLRGMRRVADENPHLVVFAELADEHLRRAGSSAADLLDEAVRLGWRYDVLETGTGRPATLESSVPLSVCLVRAA